MRIIHNLGTREIGARWYMAHGSTSTEYIFINVDTGEKVVRTPSDGWTRDDAETFHMRLMGWDNFTVSEEVNDASR